MSGRLHNRHILLTRPRQQAQNLVKLIDSTGGRASLFPTIEIKPVKTSGALRHAFDHIERYKYVIFISRNAVTHTFGRYLRAGYPLPDKTRFMAIGSGTAAELARYGSTNIIHAGDTADSEALLAQTELQSPSVSGQRLLLVRGIGGRGLLGAMLTQRGATVDYAEVYRRCLPVYDAMLLKKLWQEERIDAAIVTSHAGLKNLIRLTPTQYRCTLFNTPLVLMSTRGAKLAQKLGFVAKLEVVTVRNDQGLLLSLMNIF